MASRVFCLFNSDWWESKTKNICQLLLLTCQLLEREERGKKKHNRKNRADLGCRTKVSYKTQGSQGK